MVGWIAGVAVGNFTYPPESYLGVEAPVRLNQAAGQIMNTIGSLAWLLATLAIPAAAASLVIRFRRSRGQERQQLKWLAYAAALLALGILGIGLIGILEQLGWIRPQITQPVLIVLGGVAILGVTGLPVTAGLAILQLSAVRDRPDHQPHPGLRAPDRPARRRLCRPGPRLGAAVWRDRHRAAELGGRRGHPGRGRPVPAGPPPHPAGG